MKSLSKKEETFKEPCMTSCLDPHRNGKIAMHPQAFPEHHNLQKYPTISLPHAMSDRPYWLMTDREVRHIWRISMTPVISTLCKSSCDVNSHRDNFLPENLTNLFLNEAGGIEYPDNYTGDDFYFARYISRKGPTTGKDRTAPVGNLLLIPTVPQTRPGRKVSKVPPISNEVHLKSILPHVPKLANRSEKIVDGALGKISLNSLRHPKRSISIDSKSAAPISKLVENGAFSKMASLAIAEKTYQDLNGECGEQSFLSLISDSHTLLSLVQTPKGKRTIPLIISAISSSESLSSSACLLSIFQTILCNLCLFLSSTSGSPLHHVDYIKDNDAATVESILTPFVSFLSQLSIAEIFELSEKNYHSARPSTTHFHFQGEFLPPNSISRFHTWYYASFSLKWSIRSKQIDPTYARLRNVGIKCRSPFSTRCVYHSPPCCLHHSPHPPSKQKMIYFMLGNFWPCFRHTSPRPIAICL